MNKDDVLAIFRECGAMLEGHFILSSGLRSPVFLQKARVFQYPAQTEKLCKALRDRFSRGDGLPKIDALLSSTLPRALQTAEIVAEGLDGLTVEVDPELVEHRPGEADGVRFVDFGARFGSFDLRADPDRPLAPGAESLRQFYDRVGTVMRGVIERHRGATVCVVCHGGVIDNAFRQLAELPHRLGDGGWDATARLS